MDCTKAEPILKKKTSKNIAIKNVTHLFLNDKKIQKFASTNLENIVALYLHNNEIELIENLESATNLNFLYLQNNRIAKINNLENLKNLKKLYLGQNSISVVEGLANLQNLEELHLENQYLSGGNSLCFDPRSIVSVMDSLQVLNISYNKITSIKILSVLRHLVKFDASYNRLEDIDEVCETIKNWRYLRECSFVGNKICKMHRYRDSIISRSYLLEILDEKDISAATRKFIKQFELERLKQGEKGETNQPLNLADVHTSLPKNYPHTIQKAVSVQIMRNAQKFPEGEEQPYVPWKAIPKSSSNKVMPSSAQKELMQKKRIGHAKCCASSTFPVVFDKYM